MQACEHPLGTPDYGSGALEDAQWVTPFVDVSAAYNHLNHGEGHSDLGLAVLWGVGVIVGVGGCQHPILG